MERAVVVWSIGYAALSFYLAWFENNLRIEQSTGINIPDHTLVVERTFMQSLESS
jgi:hypothetical protein